MLNIYCSNKLSTLIKTEKFENREVDSKNDWSAHIFSIAGRKCVIVVNKETLYSVVLIDILKKDLQKLPLIFTESFINQLDFNGILTPEFENHIRETHKLAKILSTDNDRKTMGSLNDFIYHIKGSYEDSRDLDKVKTYSTKYLNEMRSKMLKYSTPNEMMREQIKNFV